MLDTPVTPMQQRRLSPPNIDNLVKESLDHFAGIPRDMTAVSGMREWQTHMGRCCMNLTSNKVYGFAGIPRNMTGCDTDKPATNVSK